jgi:predicted Zn-dependent protease
MRQRVLASLAVDQSFTCNPTRVPSRRSQTGVQMDDALHDPRYSPKRFRSTIGHCEALSEFVRVGRLDVALALVQDILKRRPDDHNAAQILALLLVQSGKLEAALPYLAAAVAAEPRANQYRNNYANTLLQLKRYADAVEQWERAVEVDPQYTFGWLGLACARIHLHDSAGARQAAERGLALRPGWPEMTRALVVALEGAVTWRRLSPSVSVPWPPIRESPPCDRPICSCSIIGLKAARAR